MDEALNKLVDGVIAAASKIGIAATEASPHMAAAWASQAYWGFLVGLVFVPIGVLLILTGIRVFNKKPGSDANEVTGVVMGVLGGIFTVLGLIGSLANSFDFFRVIADPQGAFLLHLLGK